MVAVVTLHAAGPYCSRPLPGLLWPVYEPAPSLFADGATRGAGATDIVFWTARSFAVPLFFFVAGVFAGRTLLHTGPADFFRARARRLFVPLLGGLCVVLPAMYVIWTWGWVRFGWASWEHLLHGRFGPAIQHHFRGPGHLWYLIHLLLASLLLAPVGRRVAMLGQRLCAGDAGPLVAGTLGVVLVGAAGAACGAASNATLHQFPNWFLPHPGLFFFHFAFFVWGALACGSTFGRSAREDVRCTWMGAVLLVIGLGAAALMAPRIAPGLLDAPNEPPPHPLDAHRRALQAGAMAISAVCTILGLTMLLARAFLAQRLAPPGRASLWVYTTHLVWMGLCMVALYRVPVAGEAKMCVVLVAGLAVPLLTRPIAARTRVGRWLGA